MSCLLNSWLNVKDGLTRFNHRPDLVPLTNELLVSARMAHYKYIYFIKKPKKKKKIEEENKTILEQKLKQKKEADVKI